MNQYPLVYLDHVTKKDVYKRQALLNCAEVGRRNRILTNYRFLSHSLF